MAQSGDGSGAWVPFVRWLQQHTSSPPSAHPAGSNATGSSDQPNPRTSNPAGAAASLQHQHQLQHAGQPTLAQPPFASTRRPGARGGVQAAIADCRTENRLLEGYSARQELSVVLAVPGLGLPVNRAPTLTAKQAMSLLKAISEPLISLEAGRLTRKLSSPTKLQPTEERGVLSLWLLPNDDLALCWQTSVQAPAAAGAAGEGRQAGCNVAVWEALAHFPEGCFYDSDEPVAVIHTLRNDASGRSFYIRPRADVAAHATERAAQQLAQASGSAPPTAAPLGDGLGQPRFYFWLRGQDVGAAMHSLGRLKSLLRRPPTLARRAGVPPSKLEEISSWLLKMEAAAAKQATAQQQPSQEAGIAVSSGGSMLEAVPSDSMSDNQDMQPSTSLAPKASSSGSGGDREAFLSSQPPLPRQPAPPASPAPASSLLPGMLLGRSGPNPAITSALTSVRMAAALSSIVSSSQASAVAHLPAAPTAPASAAAAQPIHPACSAAAEEPAEGPSIHAGTDRGSSAAAGAEEPGVQQAAAQPSMPIATSTVSASASALYHDRRFNLSAPVAVTVVATSLVQGGTAAAAAQQGGSAWDAQGAPMAGLQAEAVQLATTVAQQQAQGVLESTGRRLMEEQLAEAVISTIRSTRSSHRQRAQSQRAREEAAQEERRFRTALAMPAIRAAAARASGRGLLRALSHSSPRHPSAGGASGIPAVPAAAAAAAELGYLPQETAGDRQAASEPVLSAGAGGPAEQPAVGQFAVAAERCSPQGSRLRRRLVAAAPNGRGAGSGRVTLCSLQELLRATDEAPAGGSDSSECSAAPAPADQLQQDLGQGQEQRACSEAGSVQGDGEKGGGSGAEDGSSTPRRVSLGSLFKLLNGCLDR